MTQSSLVDATPEEAEAILSRTRERGLVALTAAGFSEHEGLRLIRERHAQLLPEGTATPGHRFAWICAADGERIGECWFGPLEASETDWYVFDIELAEQHRGRGHGKTALAAIAESCRRAGARRLGLTVALDNERAFSAYRSLGFVVTKQDASSAEMWLQLPAA